MHPFHSHHPQFQEMLGLKPLNMNKKSKVIERKPAKKGRRVAELKVNNVYIIIHYPKETIFIDLP